MHPEKLVVKCLAVPDLLEAALVHVLTAVVGLAVWLVLRSGPDGSPDVGPTPGPDIGRYGGLAGRRNSGPDARPDAAPDARPDAGPALGPALRSALEPDAWPEAGPVAAGAPPARCKRVGSGRGYSQKYRLFRR